MGKVDSKELTFTAKSCSELRCDSRQQGSGIKNQDGIPAVFGFENNTQTYQRGLRVESQHDHRIAAVPSGITGPV